MTPRPTIYILDAYSLIYQVFHAIPLMTSPSGQPTNAVFGIFRDLLNILKTRKPEYLAAAFDGAEKTKRAEKYETYKAQRGPMPEDMVPQIPVIRRLFEAFQVPVLLHPGAEADDVIATLARRATERGLDVVICTADKDARQLLDEHTRILNLRKGEFLDVEGLKKDWGVSPDQVVDTLALTGDSVDNVPGVPGIGLKTAVALLQEFGSIDNILDNLDKVSGAKRKQNLDQHRETVKIGRELITLETDLPLELDWEALKSEGYDAPALRTLCIECGFHRFLEEIVETQKVVEAPWDVDYRLVDTPEKLREFAEELNRQPRICLDTETTSIDPLRARLVGFSFAWEPGVAYYLPVRGPMGSKVLALEAVLDAVRPSLTNPEVEKVGQNVKYEMLVLGQVGITIEGPVTDTMVLSYLLESGERNHSLDQLSQRLLNHAMIPISELIGKGKKQLTMDQVDLFKVAEYAGEDADATWRIEEILTPRLREQGLWDLYADLERPLIGVLARMETVGIKVDVTRLQALSKEFASRIEAIEAEIYREAGHPFNIGSLPQLRQVLFDELKLPSYKKTPGGEPSTDSEVLESLAGKHPIPRLLVEHRHFAKLKSTYLDTLSELADEEGRIHASFNQVVAATGRLSSSDPNLQNIPIRSEDGGQIRQAFVAGFPGWSLVAADYSQIELRILAHYTQDPALVRAFAQDIDIHTAVAARIFKVAESEVTSNQRRVAKTVNFGVIYGIKAFGLATRLGITQQEAGAFIDAYFDEYAGVEAFMNRTLEAAARDGYVETILGRRRAINGIKNTTGRNLNLAERTAVNAVIQGSAADLIKRAMLEVDRRIRGEGLRARMLLQIHDELVFESPDDEIDRLAPLIRESMVGAIRFDVPIQVEIAVGPNWLDVASLPDS
ncbi:DNA polymerase I [Tundrisphaera lichenicola]|uniref:DNA polymerase I n=1 Tax=Tundrisphaera lichenicola TaxID=2029860 RepID=UPI003EB96BE7